MESGLMVYILLGEALFQRMVVFKCILFTKLTYYMAGLRMFRRYIFAERCAVFCIVTHTCCYSCVCSFRYVQFKKAEYIGYCVWRNGIVVNGDNIRSVYIFNMVKYNAEEAVDHFYTVLLICKMIR
jgi:hypothetical protein